jgi:hypothetical protein
MKEEMTDYYSSYSGDTLFSSYFQNVTPWNAMMGLDGGGNAVTVPQTNGQLLIGNTGSLPTAASLIVSANLQQTLGAGSISLDTVQNIQTSSSPSFTGLTVSGLTPALPVQTGVGGTLTTGLINLTSQVQNILAIANGGNGSATPGITSLSSDLVVGGTWPNQTLTVTGVVLSVNAGTNTSIGGTSSAPVVNVIDNPTFSGLVTCNCRIDYHRDQHLLFTWCWNSSSVLWRSDVVICSKPDSRCIGYSGWSEWRNGSGKYGEDGDVGGKLHYIRGICNYIDSN